MTAGKLNIITYMQKKNKCKLLLQKPSSPACTNEKSRVWKQRRHLYCSKASINLSWSKPY